MRDLIDRLAESRVLSGEEFKHLLLSSGTETDEYLFSRARTETFRHYGNRIFIRGLIEFTNYCRNDCLYCGIRKGNAVAERYHLTGEEILACCEEGYRLGFRTFVLQGGEDLSYSRESFALLISEIRRNWPDCAITLSIGERDYEDYLAFYRAGADRFLLRHETATEEHYGQLHPPGMSLGRRKQCLWDLKRIGYQVGSGIMVGAPYQTADHLVRDLEFLRELEPQMIGIGPFLPHRDSVFRDFRPGGLQMTLRLLGILRLMFPTALIPATTALATLHPRGRELGIRAGANVVMPNLSPMPVREKYMLYDNKASSGEESAQSLERLRESMAGIGCEVVSDRGDCPGFVRRNRDQTEEKEEMK